MSTPADQELKNLRRKAHQLLEKTFGKWYDKEAKKMMYEWLEVNTAKGHIGLMDKNEVEEVIAILTPPN